MKQAIEKTEEETVLEVLRKHYTQFNEETHKSAVANIVTLLHNETMRFVDVEDGFESDAAYLTRMVLLEVFRQGVSSVKATTEIFNSLERGHELGWLAD